MLYECVNKSIYFGSFVVESGVLQGMRGELFIYDVEDRLVAFESGPSEEGLEKSIILIGGMTDGLLALPYTDKLGDFCLRNGLSLVQPLFSSSYTGFGVSSLDRDARQLVKLLAYLRMQRPNLREIYLLGHSTGCQDILFYLANYHDEAHMVRGAFLQGPVSDRDYMLDRYPDAVSMLRWAEERCAAGEPTAVHWKLYDGIAPIDAYRARSLLSRLGDDDYFSLDLSMAERGERVARIGVPVTMVVSGKDEYYPMGKTARDLQEHYCNFSFWGWDVKILPEADHAISRPEDQATFIDYLAGRLSDDRNLEISRQL